MEKKDFKIHDVGEVNLFDDHEEMNSTVFAVKEEVYSEESSDVNDNDQVSINDSETPFCFVGIKMENPDDYECEASSTHAESKNTSVMYASNQERQSYVDDHDLAENPLSTQSNMSSIQIKMECDDDDDDDDDSCKSNNVSVPKDIIKECNSRSVVHECDMGHSSTEFIRGINCQEYPILKEKIQEGENTVMKIAPNSGNLSGPVEFDDAYKNEVTINSSCNVHSSRVMLKEPGVLLERASLKGFYPSLQTETGNKASEFNETCGTSLTRKGSMKYEKELSNESSDHQKCLNHLHNEPEYDTGTSCRLPDTSTRQTEYASNTCEESFRENSGFKMPMKSRCGGKSFSCEICEVSFNRNHHLKRHMKTHTQEKPFSCDVCQASFNQEGNLKRHMRTHTGEKPFLCDVCQVSFSAAWTLKTHMRTHTGEKSYSCDVCQISFSEAESHKTHMRTHTGEKPFSCEVCRVSFSEAESLETHVRTHTGDKPFSCCVCQTSFTQDWNLKRHMRTHIEEKRFSCDVCHVSFSRNSDLKIHTRTHTGEKPFSCDVCQVSFSRKGVLKKHKRTHTGDKTVEAHKN